MLGGTVVANWGWGIVFQVVHGGHGYVVEAFNVAREDGVDVIADGFLHG
jgi:hypothetical protein